MPSRAKLIDLAFASPLIAFYAWTASDIAVNISPTLGLGLLIDGLNLAFLTLCMGLFIARRPPVGKLPGIAPRLTAFMGTFAPLMFPHLPRADTPTSVVLLSAVLISIGLSGALFSFAHLGRQVSIMPEARKLITSGPYAVVRHPIYVFEQIAILGIALQFQQPVALILFGAHAMLQVCRTYFEERVLTGTFPEYAAYRESTPRFIPLRKRPTPRLVGDGP